MSGQPGEEGRAWVPWGQSDRAGDRMLPLRDCAAAPRIPLTGEHGRHGPCGSRGSVGAHRRAWLGRLGSPPRLLPLLGPHPPLPATCLLTCGAQRVNQKQEKMNQRSKKQRQKPTPA